MSLLNAIIVAVGLRKKHETSNTYAMLERIWSEYDVYEKMRRSIPRHEKRI